MRLRIIYIRPPQKLNFGINLEFSDYSENVAGYKFIIPRIKQLRSSVCRASDLQARGRVSEPCFVGALFSLNP